MVHTCAAAAGRTCTHSPLPSFFLCPYVAVPGSFLSYQDIYSLAIMLWELLAGERPWQGCNVLDVAIKVVLQGVRPPLERLPESRCPPKLRTLIKSCWETDPRRRPAAAEVVKVLALIQQVRLSDKKRRL
jgi:serine/threonine protein kinase